MRKPGWAAARRMASPGWIMTKMGRASCLAMVTALLAQSSVVPPELKGFPYTDETLNYSVISPVGVSLGKVQMTARQEGPRGWAFNFTLDASLPKFPIVDRFTSYASSELCSIRLEKGFQHGSRKSSEVTYIDKSRSVAIRGSRNGGGLSEIPVGLCP